MRAWAAARGGSGAAARNSKHRRVHAADLVLDLPLGLAEVAILDGELDQFSLGAAGKDERAQPSPAMEEMKE